MGGELAGGLVLDLVYKDSPQYWVDQIKEGAARSADNPRIAYSTAIITNQQTYDEVHPHTTYRLVDSPPEVREKIDTSDQNAAAVRETMVSSGLEEAGKLIKTEWVDPFVIKGTPQECAAELKSLMAKYQMNEYLLPILNTKEASRLMKEVSEVLRFPSN